MSSVRIFVVGLALAIISGCSSSPVPTNQATPVAANRLLAPIFMRSPCAKCGILIVKRDAHTWLHAGAPEKLFVGETEIALLWPGEKVRVYLPAGYYVLSARGRMDNTVPTAAVDIKVGQTRVYRLSVTPWTILIQPAVR